MHGIEIALFAYMESHFSNKNIYRFILFFSCAIICISIFFPFISTVAVAAIFALVLNPFIKKIQNIKIFGFSIICRKKSAAILLFFLMILFIVPFGIMSVKIYSQFREFSDTDVAKQKLILKFSQYILRFEDEISHYISGLGLKRQITVDDVSGGLAQKAVNILFDAATHILTKVPSLLMALLIFLAALFYFLAESDKIENFFRRLGLFSFREINIVGESLKVSSYSAVVSTIIAGMIHGLIVAIGAQAVRVGDFSVVFMLTFFLSFIPVIGATLMALGLCIPAIIEQNYTAAFVLLSIALFASAIDNFIRPFFLVYGNRLTHPFISLLSVLGGIYIFGMAGLFIGPVLVQVTIESLPKLVRLAPNPRTHIYTDKKRT